MLFYLPRCRFQAGRFGASRSKALTVSIASVMSPRQCALHEALRRRVTAIMKAPAKHASSAVLSLARARYAVYPTRSGISSAPQPRYSSLQ
ncbi:hypothetical protein HNR23_003463 [Nocardiopsis mwathae]|uniref:Uncharacterized protein n=1 Tax=Nocardiopsis mwathae TaxID=1472723 RepID=A0A7X0D6K3_9ACTN|nr:hypothetical protein [Nocardiopsis mwathae]